MRSLIITDENGVGRVSALSCHGDRDKGDDVWRRQAAPRQADILLQITRYQVEDVTEGALSEIACVRLE
jgi:hypothetical protein